MIMEKDSNTPVEIVLRVGNLSTYIAEMVMVTSDKVPGLASGGNLSKVDVGKRLLKYPFVTLCVRYNKSALQNDCRIRRRHP